MRPAALLLATLLAAPATSPSSALRVKASAVARPCVATAAALFERSTGHAVAVQTGALEAATSADGSDVVVGAIEELTRVLESGASDLAVDAEIATIPWVALGAPAGSDLRALARSAVPLRMLGGVVAREARRILAGQGIEPRRLGTLAAAAGPLRPAAGEYLIVPLSLAGRGTTAALAVPPLTIRAAAVRATPRPGEARAFVEFLTAGAGNEAFRACGREAAR